MRLWKRASGVLKDKNSLWKANLIKVTVLRNPEIGSAIVKATNHDEFSIDNKYFEIVISMSSSHLKPILWEISGRMNKTRSWVVALKGLMLIHGIFACKIPDTGRIGRLPFDLSDFRDGYSEQRMKWDQNAFVRAYFAFLDKKSSLLQMNMYDCRSTQTDDQENCCFMNQELLMVQKYQGLLDLLLQIRPRSDAAVVPLILEAMDYVILEIFDVYSRICRGISLILSEIYSAGQAQAALALRILQKATNQGDELSLYLSICRRIGVMNGAEYPKIEQIPEKLIWELGDIINGTSKQSNDDDDGHDEVFQDQQAKEYLLIEFQTPPNEEDKAIVLYDSRKQLRTIITHDWEIFDDDDDQDLKMANGESFSTSLERSGSKGNPFI